MKWSLQQVFCYEVFVLDYMFLYLQLVKDYTAHDCYYTERGRKTRVSYKSFVSKSPRSMWCRMMFALMTHMQWWRQGGQPGHVPRL